MGKGFSLKEYIRKALLLIWVPVTTCAIRLFFLLQFLFIPHVPVSPGVKAELLHTNTWNYEAQSQLQTDHILGQMSQNGYPVTIITCKTVPQPNTTNRGVR